MDLLRRTFCTDRVDIMTSVVLIHVLHKHYSTYYMFVPLSTMASWVHTVIYVGVGVSRLRPTEVRVLKRSLRKPAHWSDVLPCRNSVCATGCSTYYGKRPVHWYHILPSRNSVRITALHMSYTKFVHSNAHSCYCRVFMIVCISCTLAINVAFPCSWYHGS